MAQILIADDDPEYRETFHSSLSLLGHDVVSVGSAVDARKALEKGEFDVVFLDVVMPGGGAVTLIHELSASYPTLPLVAISGQSHLFETPLFQEGLRKAAAVMKKTASLREVNDTIKYVAG